MTQEEAIARLSQYQTNELSKWREKEEERRLNVPILQYEFA